MKHEKTSKKFFVPKKSQSNFLGYNKLIDIISTILLAIGFFLAFLPHAFHTRVGFSESSHIKHLVYGMILVVVSLGILIYNNKALRIWNRKHLN